MKRLRHIVSILVIVLIAVLAAGTIFERLHSSDFALTHEYGTWWFAGLWALLASLMVYMTVLCAAFRCLNKSAYRTAKNFPRRHHFVGVGAFAFQSVVITYFGVNLILGGVHAYN